MNTSARQLAVTLLLLMAVTVPGQASAQSSLPASFEVGMPFPTLSLPSLDDGRSASIADFRGQKVILHIFASW